MEAPGDVHYASQRKDGTALAAPGTARWSLVWTAPATRQPVACHVAANAGDGDGTAEGDHVHTAVVEAAPLVSRF